MLIQLIRNTAMNLKTTNLEAAKRHRFTPMFQQKTFKTSEALLMNSN